MNLETELLVSGNNRLISITIEFILFEMFNWVHFIAAVLAIMLGMINLVSEKGTPQHRMVGWF